MRYVKLLINLPVHVPRSIYIYQVPEAIADQVCFGKRALVEFGGQHREGYIVETFSGELEEGIKPILRILDEETVFNEELLSLAEWMSAYYAYPVARVLDLMIPKILRKHKAAVYVPAIDRNTYEAFLAQGINLNPVLFDCLLNDGEISVSKAEKISSSEELAYLENKGCIIRSGSYKTRIVSDQYKVYTSGPQQIDIKKLQKRAPRQAEAIECIQDRGTVSYEELLSRFHRSTIKALEEKAYIQAVKLEDISFYPSDLQLNDEQEQAVKEISQALRENDYRKFLLFGVTGSGKTEVYLQTAIESLKQGKSVLILVPEIALTRQIVEVFSKRISPIAVLHSAMSAGERYEEWMRIKRGEARLVLGPRSAVFAPVKNLGLIIVDEEQESSYKQEEMPRYHTREIAAARAKNNEAVLVMGSATPSLDTFYQARQGNINLLTLSHRVSTGGMPDIRIEDMRKKRGQTGLTILSPYLQNKIGEKLAYGQQTILFINRRGYSPMTICRECGTIATCPHCSVGMTYHKDKKQYLCHYCNYQLEPTKKCTVCGSNYLQLVGMGTQKVEEEIRAVYPEARVGRLDLDSSRKKGVQKTIIKDMQEGSLDILIGTQMVAKGLDFPGVSLVGIIDADSILNLPDFHAAERCFQLLVQAAGRAGRADTAGEVVIQTYQPDHPVIQLAARQDYMAFYHQEISKRNLLNYPPFASILRVVASAQDEMYVKHYMSELEVFLKELLGASEEEYWILGPAPCPIAKINRLHRYQILIKSPSLPLLQSTNEYIYLRKIPKGIRLEQDLNPIATM